MGLSAGTRLGPYEIVAPLGAGGMGEVYRARDTRLERTVAIKVLHSSLIATPELKARFDREARAISQLNHPHICTVHDVGHDPASSADYMVMEYLEGQTLADRLEKGPLPIDQALKVAIQVAEAPEKAHASGIIHRDLKPGNIMLTKGGAKLMDFGLAKPMASTAVVGAGGGPLTPSTPTMTIGGLSREASPLTQQGHIVGTFQYLAPEVLEGREADERSDIFALGIVMYEMITGRRAFNGKSQLAVISAILNQEPPPIATIRPDAPLSLQYVAATCMAKEPGERFQTVHDVRLQLKFIAESGSQAAIAISAGRTRWGIPAYVVVTASLLILLAAGLLFWKWRATPAVSPVIAYVPAPLDTRLLSFGFGAGPAVVSPDGTKLAFSAINKDGVIKLWVRPIGSRDATPVAGTDNASAPFWSPDSSSLGFFADAKLKTVNLSTGNLDTLCDVADDSGTWSSKGAILFTDVGGKPFRSIPAGGGQPTALPALNAGDRYESHPSFLPDGDHFLFEAGNDSGSRIEMGSLSSGGMKEILTNARRPSYVAGHLLFLRGSKLFAQQFEPTSGALSGSAVPLADADAYSASDTVLAFKRILRQAHLQWFDIDGDSQGFLGGTDWYLSPKISRDGKRVMAVVETPGARETELVSVPASGGASTRLTLGPGWKSWSVWSPDGRYMAYSKHNEDDSRLVRKPADGSGPEETLLKFPDTPNVSVVDWSPDGRYLSYDISDRKDGIFKQWILPLFGDRKPFQVAPVSKSQFDGNFSPDGHWVAYFSYETGRPEVFVAQFPGPGAKYQISNGGGWLVRWAKGNKLFFVTTGNRLMEADLELTPQSLQIKSLRPLFQLPLLDTASPLFDVSADGQRVIIVSPADPETNTIGLLLNWQTLARGK